jgi:hypothetical protein
MRAFIELLDPRNLDCDGSIPTVCRYVGNVYPESHIALGIERLASVSPDPLRSSASRCARGSRRDAVTINLQSDTLGELWIRARFVTEAHRRSCPGRSPLRLAWPHSMSCGAVNACLVFLYRAVDRNGDVRSCAGRAQRNVRLSHGLRRSRYCSVNRTWHACRQIVAS